MNNNSKSIAVFIIVIAFLCCLIFSCCFTLSIAFDTDFTSEFDVDNTEDIYEDYETVEITLQREPCFGFCPIYTLTITESGETIFEGENFVNNPGETENYKISEAKVRSLIAEFKDVDFFDLEDEYIDYYVTDLPGTTISLRLDNKFKSIRLYGLEDTVPEELEDLAKSIDRAANVDEFTDNPESLYE